MTKFLQNMARAQFNRWDLLGNGYLVVAFVDWMSGDALWIAGLALVLAALCRVASVWAKSSA